MSDAALRFCLQLQLAQARLQLLLDDELGTHHGLSLADFTLLQLLAQAPERRLALPALAKPLGISPSAALRRLGPLEKIGLLQRAAAAEAAPRQVQLRPAGLSLLREAQVTAEQVCADAMAAVPAACLPEAHAALTALAGTPWGTAP